MHGEMFWMMIVLLVVAGVVGLPIASVILLVGIKRRQKAMSGALADLKRELQHKADRPASSVPAETPPITSTAEPVVPPASTPSVMQARAETKPPTPTEERISRPAPDVKADLRHAPEPAPKPKPRRKPAVRSRARHPNAIEAAAKQVLRSIWNWIIVSEEHRRPGMSAEQAVATNWLIRIGVPVMVAGIGFFLKYTSDAGWLNAQAKVTLTLLVGAGFLTAGIRLLGNRYDLLAQGLLGAGLASLYGAVFAAANIYHLVGVLPAFGLMVCVTIGAGVMSVRFNSMSIAILGIIGGYGTPVVLSTGSGNLVGLYSYMVLLGIGVLGVARRRGWHLLNLTYREQFNGFAVELFFVTG